MNALQSIRQKQNLFSLIEQRKRGRGSIEIILGTGMGRQEETAERLRGLGRVRHVYGLVPFFSMLLTPEEAEEITGFVYQGEARIKRLCSFEKSYGRVLRDIVSVDASSTYTLVPNPYKTGKNIFTDIKIEELWNLKNIGAYDAQAISTGEGVSIGIIDTGVDYTHSQLRGLFGQNRGYDFIRGNNDPMDRQGHGTHVAGIASSPDFGVSPGSTLYAIRVLDEKGIGSESDIIAGIEYCIKNEIDVVNMSLGAPDASRAFEAICQAAYEAGLVLVAAAGNDGYGPNYPAAFGQSVISVAAVDSNNEHAYFSNIWKTNDISAPGVDIISCYPGERITSLDGTSMAAPHVTGVVALALAKSTDAVSSIEDLIADTAENLSYDGEYDSSWLFGSGLVRADRVMERIVAARFRSKYKSGKGYAIKRIKE